MMQHHWDNKIKFTHSRLMLSPYRIHSIDLETGHLSSVYLIETLSINELKYRIYIFKFNNRSTKNRCEICLKLAIKTTERRHWRYSSDFVVNFEHVPHFFQLLILKNEFVCYDLISWNNSLLYYVELHKFVDKFGAN